MLLLLPMISLYQTYVAAHGYDLLSPAQQRFYDFMEMLTSPFTSDPEKGLDAIKGTTWSGRFFGLQLSDPLAVLGQIAAGFTLYWPFVLSALIPVAATLLLGRIYCGWICPATFLYELNSNVAALLRRAGLNFGRKRLDRRFKYLVLFLGLVLSAVFGSVWVALIYPPAIIGRELYYAIALNGFGVGAVFFVLTLLFDILVARRGFCRYLCPGGALYSLLGRYRLLRIRRDVRNCNDCVKCNAICEFGLNPMRDDFGQECNNCSACIAACPTDALSFGIAIRDLPNQGDGHLGPRYRRQRAAGKEAS
ncbi:MAG TPA: 4Fe-4S binding protein [Gammaproteobacteria bacterium]|nr:4Fe-4S binding protein [Gammaproteobacteria bacterium]